MAKIAKSTAKRTVPGGILSATARPVKTITETVLETGKAALNLTSTFLEIQERRQNRVNKNFINDYDNKLKKHIREEILKQKQFTLSDAAGSKDRFNTSIDEFISQNQENIPDSLREDIGRLNEQRRDEGDTKVLEHEIREEKAQTEQILKNDIFEATESAADDSSLTNLQTVLAETEAKIRGYNFPPENETARIIDAKNKIAIAHVESLINKNPELAKSVLESDQYRDLITVNQKNSLIDIAERDIAAIEAERKRVEAQAEKDAKDAFDKAAFESDQDFIERIGDPVNPTTWPEVQKNEFISGSRKQVIRNILENQTKEGQKLLDTTDILFYGELSTEIEDTFNENTSEDVKQGMLDRIQDALGKGLDKGLSKSDRDSLIKKVELKTKKGTDTLKKNQSKNAHDVITTAENVNLFNSGDDVDNSIKANKMRNDLDKWILANPDKNPMEFIEDRLPTIENDFVKDLLDSFNENILKFTPFGIGKQVGGLLREEDELPEAVEDFFRRNPQIPKNQKNIDLATERLK